MKKYTINDILAMNPCQPIYNRKRLLEMARGRDSVTALEILRERIPLKDKIWIGIQMLSEKQRRKFACQCALDVIYVWEAPEIVVRYLKTQDESIRSAAGSAAESAAGFVAGSAAGSAAEKRQLARLRRMLRKQND